MDRNVSRIREHDLRSVWENEERDFTRWLTENIDLLASELGIEIEDARAEEAVGDFSADIVAREMNTGETVVIENQYNRTDHDHLGKLLTYSSGKNAGFTMWLAEEFRPEHRSVLEWLNESGPKGAKFFAIRPRVVSIEGSEERGFEFDVVVEPNEWEREVSNEEIFEALKQEQTDIETNLGVELEWERLPEKQASRIKQPKNIDGTITELTADQRKHLIKWGVDAMDKFQEEFEPRISALELPC